MKLIDFADKVATKTSSTPRKNCITDQDINDIKEAVNENANICQFLGTEELIGKLGNDNLYRIRLEQNINLGLNTNANIDISSLGAKEVFVNYNYSYFLDEEDNHIPLNAIQIKNSSYSGLRNYSNSLIKITNTALTFNLGSESDWKKIVLVLEYTKNS